MAIGSHAPTPTGLVITPNPGAPTVGPGEHRPATVPGSGDLWEHRTLIPADFTAAGAVIDFPGDVELVAIESASSDPVYCAFGPGASSAAGSYRFKAPGGGILVIPVPRIRQLSLYVGATGVPVAPVEVYAFAGRPADLAAG